MKVKLDQITVVQVDSEIPEKCPKCETDFTNENEQNLIEIQFINGEQRCNIENGRIDNYGDTEDESEARFAQGYKCANCEEILALIKEDVEISEILEKELKKELKKEPSE